MMNIIVAIAALAAFAAVADARALLTGYDPVCKIKTTAVCEKQEVDYGHCGHCDLGYACEAYADKKCMIENVWEEVCEICKPILTKCGDSFCKYDEECTTGTVCKEVKDESDRWIKKCEEEDICVKIENPKKCETVVVKECKEGAAEDLHNSEKHGKVCKDVEKEVCKPYEEIKCGYDRCEIGDECVVEAPCEKVLVQKESCVPKENWKCVKKPGWSEKCGNDVCEYGSKCVWKQEEVCEKPEKPVLKPEHYELKNVEDYLKKRGNEYEEPEEHEHENGKTGKNFEDPEDRLPFHHD